LDVLALSAATTTYTLESTFDCVPEIVELIQIKTHLSREFGSNA
jgi:hypothetical protein